MLLQKSKNQRKNRSFLASAEKFKQALMVAILAIMILNLSATYAQSPERDTLRSGDFFVSGNKPILVNLPPAPYSPYSPTVRSRAGFIALAAYAAQPTYNQVFVKENEATAPIPEREIRTHTLRLAGEYGINHHTMFSFQIPVCWLQSLGPTEGNINPQTLSGRLAGLGNTELGLRYRFNVPRYVLSASLRVGLPARKNNPQSGLATGLNTCSLMPMLHIGTPIGFHSYVFLFNGYGWRSRQYGQVLHCGAAFGHQRTRFGFELASVFLHTYHAHSARVSSQQQALGLYLPQQSYWTFEAKGNWRFSRFLGLNLGLSVPVWGHFYPKMPTLEAAVYFQWD